MNSLRLLPICIYVEQCCNCVLCVCCHFGQWEIQLALVSKKVEVHHLLQNFSCPGGQPLHNGIKIRKNTIQESINIFFPQTSLYIWSLISWRDKIHKILILLASCKLVFALNFHIFFVHCRVRLNAHAIVMGSLWFHTLGVENFYGVFDSWIIFNDIILIYFDLKLTKFEMNFENREDLKDPTPKTQIYTQCFLGKLLLFYTVLLCCCSQYIQLLLLL